MYLSSISCLLYLLYVIHLHVVSVLSAISVSYRDDPYDQVIFAPDQNVSPGRPNYNQYDFNTDHSLGKKLSREILERIDPGNEFLLKQCEVWMELATIINKGFTALGSKRVTPPFLHFLLSKKVDQLYTLASYSVRDVQYAIFNCGYSISDLYKNCPKAPPGNEPDPVLRRLKAVLNHPIGDYAVQVRALFVHALSYLLSIPIHHSSYTPIASFSLARQLLRRKVLPCLIIWKAPPTQ